jgi:hypothetical protein
MCLNETSYRIHVEKYLSDRFPIKNNLKLGASLSLLTFNFTLEYVISKVQAIQVGLISNGTHQILVYADDVNILGRNILTVRKKHRSFSNCKYGNLFRSKC